jgi:hypothetical protein
MAASGGTSFARLALVISGRLLVSTSPAPTPTHYNLADLITHNPAIYHQALLSEQQQHHHSRLDVHKTPLTERRW